VNGQKSAKSFLAKLPVSLNPDQEPVERLFKENLSGVRHNIYNSFDLRLMKGDWLFLEGHYFCAGEQSETIAQIPILGFCARMKI